jgi:hypothetical protein
VVEKVIESTESLNSGSPQVHRNSPNTFTDWSLSGLQLSHKRKQISREIRHLFLALSLTLDWIQIEATAIGFTANSSTSGLGAK